MEVSAERLVFDQHWGHEEASTCHVSVLVTRGGFFRVWLVIPRVDSVLAYTYLVLCTYLCAVLSSSLGRVGYFVAIDQHDVNRRNAAVPDTIISLPI